MTTRPSVTMPGGGASVVGIIGHPVAHSLSPTMHNSAFRALDMDWVYVPFPVAKEADLADAVAGLKALGVRGVNVTIPYKEAVAPFMDELTDRARAAGAVNTIVCEGDRLIGDNTDGIGFVRALREEASVDPKGARVLVYGAGGAARAIVAALSDAGAERIVIVNRTVARAEAVARGVARRGAATMALGLDDAGLGDVVKNSDLLVQTTPAGMTGGGQEHGMPPALRTEWLHPGLVVADIVYTPLETPLVHAALSKGCSVAPGWGMLLYQGAEAFDRWTGRAAPVDVMRRALLEGLGSNSGP